MLRGCVPPGRRGRTCRQARLRVLRGGPMRRTGAPWGLLKFACTRAGRAARVSASVRTAGCRQSPSASARIRWRALFDNTPVVIGSAAGSVCVAGPSPMILAAVFSQNSKSCIFRRAISSVGSSTVVFVFSPIFNKIMLSLKLEPQINCRQLPRTRVSDSRPPCAIENRQKVHFFSQLEAK